MKHLAILVALAGAASAASAGFQTMNGTLDRVIYDLRTRQLVDTTSNRGGFNGTVYSNVDNFTGSAFSHGSDFVRDDTNLVAGGLLSELSFSIVNFGGPFDDNYTGGLINFEFNAIAGDGSVGASLGGFQFDAAGAVDISGGGNGTILTLTGLESLGINLSAGPIWTGLNFESANAGADLDSIGQIMFNPPTVGASQDVFWLDGFGAADFGGNPVANFGWEIVTVPAPGAAALLGMGGLVAARRRR